MSRLNHVFITILFAAIAAVLSAFPAERAYGLNEDAVSTLALENQLEKRLKSILSEILGTEKIIVLVGVDTRSESGKRQDAVLLPGVPIKKEADGDSASQPLKFSLQKIAVKKLSVTVLLDQGVSETVKETVRDVAVSVLGLNSTRGDELYVSQVSFREKGIAWSALVAQANLYYLALSLVAAFFLAAAGLFLLDPFKRLPGVLKSVDWDLIRGPRRSSGFSEEMRSSSPETVERRERAKGERESSVPFAFIEERHIPDLAFLLKESPARDAAIVANYLDPGTAAKLLSGFPEDKQVEITLCLGAEDIDPERTRALEETIKNRLEYVIGGEQRLVSLLDVADEQVRNRVLKQVEGKDSAAAERIKGRIKDLETLLRELPQSAMPVVYRNVDAAPFAQVLKTLPDDIRARIRASLSAGAAERLQQEMDLSRPISATRLKNEKRGITLAIRRMLTEGLIEMENN